MFGGGRVVGLGELVAPELVAHRADGCGTCCVGNMSDLEVEGMDGEVGCAGSGGDEGEKGVRGGFIFSGEERVSGWAVWIGGSMCTSGG